MVDHARSPPGRHGALPPSSVAAIPFTSIPYPPTPPTTPMKSPNYRPGSTNRITITSVREDPCTYNTDTPEALHRFWREIIATQPEHEPDKETVVVVMMNSRLRPYAWHRVSLGSVNECAALPREILRPVIVSGAYGFALMHNLCVAPHKLCYV